MTASADFESKTENNTLWFKLDAAYHDRVVTERCDAFLVGLLLYAMVRGEDIYIDCPISAKLYYSLTNYLIPALSLANPKLRPVKVIPSNLEDASINSQCAVGTGFSGGVDSFATIYSHLVDPHCPDNYRITHLTFFNVGSHGDFGGGAARSLFKQRHSSLKSYLEESELDNIVVDSNISEILQLSFQETHTIRNMAPVLLLQKLFRTYYYSAGYRMDEFELSAHDMAHYDILNTAMLSTESVDIFSAGCQYSRVEKTAMIAEFEPTWRYLNVCVSTGANCSRCFKCMRTLFTLDILGKLNNYRDIFNLSEYKRLKDSYIAQVISNKSKYYYRDIYDEMQRRNIDIPMKSRLLAYKYSGVSALRSLAGN